MSMHFNDRGFDPDPSMQRPVQMDADSVPVPFSFTEEEREALAAFVDRERRSELRRRSWGGRRRARTSAWRHTRRGARK